MTKIIPQMEPLFDEKEADAIYAYVKSGGWLTEFKQTEALEQMICQFTGAKYCVMTNNGTTSLILALLALDIQPKDEVLIPNLTMIASPNSCVLLGAKPVLVDVENKTLCMDLKLAEKALTKRTKALMYVPFNGRSGDMKEVVDFCKKHNIVLIEDAAQALGSYYQKKHLGTFGVIGSFSFSVPKVITTGQGGALIINNTRLYKKIRKLKDFGRTKGGIDIHDEFGWNFKFTDLQAVIGIEQMKKLPERLERKKAIYDMYRQLLSEVKQVEMLPTDLTQTSPWFIDIFVPNPSALQQYLKEHAIGSRRIYPAVSSQVMYRKENKATRFPVSKRYAKRGLWLPSSANLTDLDIKMITKTIRAFYKN